MPNMNQVHGKCSPVGRALGMRLKLRRGMHAGVLFVRSSSESSASKCFMGVERATSNPARDALRIPHAARACGKRDAAEYTTKMPMTLPTNQILVLH